MDAALEGSYDACGNIPGQLPLSSGSCCRTHNIRDVSLRSAGEPHSAWFRPTCSPMLLE